MNDGSPLRGPAKSPAATTQQAYTRGTDPERVRREREARRAGCRAWSRAARGGTCLACGESVRYVLVRHGDHRPQWSELGRSG
jgi:hypothetical protein